jgi:5'-3' exonuclease
MAHLLVDARNAIYRAVYAVRADHSPGPKYHFFVCLLRLLNSWMNQTRPTSVHIFWDAPRATVWRRALLPTYKDRSDSNFVEGLAEDITLTTKVAMDFFKVMNVRQYSKKQMEADDLLYAAVSVLHPQKTIIVSTDSDMTQIPYRFSSCTVYHPVQKIELPVPTVNPAHLKALMGDESDSIDGYYGIGPKKGQALLENPVELHEYLKIKGHTEFYKNLFLIDLGMCPRLLANTMCIHRRLADPIKFDKAEINKLIMQYKVNGLQQEFADLVLPFQRLGQPSQ